MILYTCLLHPMYVMTHYISVRASRYRVFITVHQCLRSSTAKHRLQLHRELRTCIKPLFSPLPENHSCTRYPRRDDFTLIKYNTPIYTRCTYLSSNENKSKTSDELEKPEEKLSLGKKFKIMFKKYWYVLIPVHVVTSAVWFGSFYYLAASGLNVPDLLESFGAPNTWIESARDSKAGNCLLAYLLYKLATPLRYTVTVGGTTISINYLRKWGWIKPVPNKEEFKRMYEEQKGAFKDFTTTYQDKIHTKKGDLLKKKEEFKEHYVEAKEGLQRSVIESKRDFKQGVKHLSDECKHLRGLIVKHVKDGYDKKADYVAKPVDKKKNSKKD